MVAFAANSLLCRQALGQQLIDPATFTSMRVLSGALTLILIVSLRQAPKGGDVGDWRAPAMLFAYMVFFSFAYLSLSAGTGALILFGAVQLTMFITALRNGEHFPLISWVGLSLAIAGLIYLVWPGVTAPDPLGAVLMTVAGIAWGFYSLLGRGATDPLRATGRNFTYSVPLALVVSLVFMQRFELSVEGLVLAVASGAIASGCGYAIWYTALAGLSGTGAATVQLSVPVIAAFGGVILLGENMSFRLLMASAATLGGIAMVLVRRRA